MKRHLCVLVVEDQEDDFELLLRELRKGDWDVETERVDTAAAMQRALDDRVWDLVLSDWSMPTFSAPAALEVLKAKGIDIPFVIVSGTIGEDTAVEAMRSGAHDFMVKDKLARLNPAIERELREAQNRRERTKMHEQLLISDRMASVGILAAGVAHEINNPLTAVLGNLELATRDVKELLGELGDHARLGGLLEELTDSRQAAERIRDIVRDLKLFSRSGDEKRAAVDVRQVMDSSLRMAWNEIRHRARLVKAYAPTPAVHANESRLGQVFLNLIINAAQAIPEGRAANNEIRVSTSVAPDGWIVVEVSDTGVGMSPEVQKRLFTPFFTTKPVGVGTGLGLSICHRIVTELGGEIGGDSSANRGSTFRVRLPPAPPTGETIPPPIATARPLNRRGRVLVVDDEPMIAAAVQKTLGAQHDVTVSSSAADAHKRIAGGDRFDVILCDLMMPDMTGMDLHAELVKVAPDQAERIVFLTGGAFTQSARVFLDQSTNPRIEKPFDATTLQTIVAEHVR